MRKSALGLVPMLDALIGDAAIIEDGPVRCARVAEEGDRLRVDLGGLCEFLIVAMDIAERHDGVVVRGSLAISASQPVLGLGVFVEPLQVDAISISALA